MSSRGALVRVVRALSEADLSHILRGPQDLFLCLTSIRRDEAR